MSSHVNTQKMQGTPENHYTEELQFHKHGIIVQKGKSCVNLTNTPSTQN